MSRPNTTDTGGLLDDDIDDADIGKDADTDPDDIDEPDSGTDPDDEPDDVDDPLATLTDAQRAAFEAKLSRANGSAAKWRRRARGLDEQWKRSTPTPGNMPPRKPAAAARGNGTGSDNPPVVDADTMRKEMLAELRAEMAAAQQAEQVRTRAVEELRGAGLVLPDGVDKAKALDRAMRLLDLDGLDPDDVADEVETLKSTMPGLFAPKRRTGARKGGVVGPAAGTGGRTKAGAVSKGIEELFD